MIVPDATYVSIWSTTTLGYFLDASRNAKNQLVGLMHSIYAYDDSPTPTIPSVYLNYITNFVYSYDILWILKTTSYTVDSELKVKCSTWPTQNIIDNYLCSDNDKPPPIATNYGWMAVSDQGRLESDSFFGYEVNHLTFELDLFIYVQYFDFVFTVREDKENGMRLDFEIAHWFVSLKSPWIQFTWPAVAYDWAKHFFTIVPMGSTQYEIWYIRKPLVKDTDTVVVWRSWSIVTLSSRLDYEKYKIEISNAGFVLVSMKYFKYALVSDFV